MRCSRWPNGVLPYRKVIKKYFSEIEEAVIAVKIMTSTDKSTFKYNKNLYEKIYCHLKH